MYDQWLPQHGLNVVAAGTSDGGELLIAWPTRKQLGIADSNGPAHSDLLSPLQTYFLGFQCSPIVLPPRDQAFKS